MGETTLTFKKNRHKFVNSTYHFAFPTALTAISRQSRCTGEVWVAGAAVRLTAAAVPSRGTHGFKLESVVMATGDGPSLIVAQMLRVQQTMG
jgi:hypothetical protein